MGDRERTASPLRGSTFSAVSSLRIEELLSFVIPLSSAFVPGSNAPSKELRRREEESWSAAKVE